MISFADLFCGAGGATTGVLLATDRKKIQIKDGVAIQSLADCRRNALGKPSQSAAHV